MSEWLYIGLLAVAYFVIKRLPAEVMDRIVMWVIGKSGLEAVGRKALAAQPDHLTLDARPAGSGRPEAANAVESLQKRGFAQAGTYSVREMAGVIVHFLVKPEDSAVAVIYEHPKAGVWCDLQSAYADGSSYTLTNAKLGGGLEERPGHTSVRAPGLPPVILHLRLVRERPTGDMRRFGAGEVAQHFTDAYAESTAWRKYRGLSSRDVKASALEPRSACSHRRSNDSAPAPGLPGGSVCFPGVAHAPHSI
jgi:hypothetical protein